MFISCCYSWWAWRWCRELRVHRMPTCSSHRPPRCRIPQEPLARSPREVKGYGCSKHTLSLFLELERVSVTIPAGGVLIALLFVWCLLLSSETAALHLEECMPLCFSTHEAEDSFSIILGNRLKIIIKRYTGAQQINLIEAFSAFERVTQISLVGHVARNAW